MSCRIDIVSPQKLLCRPFDDPWAAEWRPRGLSGPKKVTNDNRKPVTAKALGPNTCGYKKKMVLRHEFGSKGV